MSVCLQALSKVQRRYWDRSRKGRGTGWLYLSTWQAKADRPFKFEASLFYRMGSKTELFREFCLEQPPSPPPPPPPMITKKKVGANDKLWSLSLFSKMQAFSIFCNAKDGTCVLSKSSTELHPRSKRPEEDVAWMPTLIPKAYLG